jgi:CelD/BcsL family acetyltransferase involved in cellulose biosynthesis
MTDSVRIVTSEGEFAALAAPWNALAAEAVDGNTFLTHDWLHSWWCAYRPNGQLKIVLVERAGAIVGIAPMMVQREGGLERALRRLRFIGDGTSETDHMNFIVTGGDRAGVLATLLDAIDHLSWDVAYFSQMPAGSHNTLQLLEHADRRGWLLDHLAVPCPRRRLPATYEELQRSLPGRLRTSIRSARRELESLYKVEFGQVLSVEELPHTLQSLYRNHASRWSAKGEEGVFVNAKKRDFYAALSTRLLRAGKLRFFHLKLDGRVVAQQYCFAHGATVYLLQEGFDSDFAKQSVGNVLRAMVFERLIAEGIESYDFLAGSSRHKRSWSDSEPDDLIVRAFRRSLMGRLAHGLATLRRNLRRSIAPTDAATS